MSSGRVHKHYLNRKTTDNEEVILYQRAESPNWYTRITNPNPLGKKYVDRSLRTKSEAEARRKASELFYRLRDKHSPFLANASFAKLWLQYLADEKSRGSAGKGYMNRQKQVFTRWILPFNALPQEEIQFIEDWDILTFRRFITWREEYWRKNPVEADTKINAAAVPRVSTIRTEMNIAATILRAFYIQVGKSPPDLHSVVKRKVARENGQQNRAMKKRGFAVPEAVTGTILDEMKQWTEEAETGRLDHLYSRMRLYWSIRFVLATRLRVGTELYNLKWGNIMRMELPNGGHTYHGYTTGKTGQRYFVMDQDFVPEWERGWALFRHTKFSRLEVNENTAYVFAGCTDPEDVGRQGEKKESDRSRRLRGDRKCESYLQGAMFRKFMNRDCMSSYKFHHHLQTGGRKNEVRITMYDWRQTAIQKLLSRMEKDMPLTTMAMLVGCSLSVMDRHYKDWNAMTTSDNVEKWSSIPEIEADEEKKEELRRQTKVSKRLPDSYDYLLGEENRELRQATVEDELFAAVQRGDAPEKTTTLVVTEKDRQAFERWRRENS